MEPRSKCYKCTDRYPGCQSECLKYKQYREELDKRNKVIRSNKESYFNMKSYYRATRDYKSR